jgi:hypothetical protein
MSDYPESQYDQNLETCNSKVQLGDFVRTLGRYGDYYQVQSIEEQFLIARAVAWEGKLATNWRYIYKHNCEHVKALPWHYRLSYTHFDFRQH